MADSPETTDLPMLAAIKLAIDVARRLHVRPMTREAAVQYKRETEPVYRGAGIEADEAAWYNNRIWFEIEREARDAE